MYVQLVWSTEGRQPWITANHEPRMHARMGAIVRKHDCRLLAIGGTENHVHLVVAMVPAVAVASLVRQVKAETSQFARVVLGLESFAWQSGYGVFTLGPRSLRAVCAYARRQKEHHAIGPLFPALEIDGRSPSEPSPEGGTQQ